MEGQAQVNYLLLKANVGQLRLKDLLRPHYPELLEQTIDPDRLAMILHYNNTMSMIELEECLEEPTTFCQNLEVYQNAKKKNAGEALIDALYETGNFHILHLLQSTFDDCKRNPNYLNHPIKTIVEKATVLTIEEPSQQLPVSTTTTTNPNNTRVSILKTATKSKPAQKNHWTHTIGEKNLSMIQEDTLDWALARVVTTPSDSGNSREYFSPIEFHADEGTAIIKFLEGQLGLDPDTQTMARPPRELFINTRSFTFIEWEMLSRMLVNYCGNSLENLWFEEVDYREYYTGIKWMDNLADHENPGIQLAKCKSFIFEAENYTLDGPTFHNMLVFIKPPNRSLQDFWNTSTTSGCRIQLWTKKFNQCQIYVDPVVKTVYSGFNVEDDLKKEIVGLLDPKSGNVENFSGNPVPVVKMYFNDTRIHLVTKLENPQNLTHVFLRCLPSNGIEYE